MRSVASKVVIVARPKRRRVSDWGALGAWATAVSLVVVAAAVGAEGSCEVENHDAYVVAARRAGIALLAAAAAMAVAGVMLAAGVLAASRTRWRVARAFGSVLSFIFALVTGFAGLLELFAFGCLE